MIRVAMADDHGIFRQGLRALLEGEADLRVVGEAADGPGALSLIAAEGPDVAVVDVGMPGATGIEVVRAVRAAGHATRVVLLTMYKEPELLAQALEAGAAGYVLKDSAFEELAFAVRQAHAGGVFVSAALMAARLRGEDKQALTPREREVLGLVARGHTSRRIAKELHISVKTVETHRANILRKLDANNTAELVRRAVERGLLLPTAD